MSSLASEPALRVLHVLDDLGPQCCGTTMAALSQRIADDRADGLLPALLLLGGKALHDAATDAGLAPFVRVTPPLGRSWLAPTVLHHAFGDHAHGGDIAGIEAWSLAALGAAAIYRPHTPRVLHVLQAPSTADRRRLNRLMMRAGFDAKTPTQHLRRSLIDTGLPPGRVFHQPLHLREPLTGTPHRVPHVAATLPISRPRVITLLGDPAWAVPTADAALAVSMSAEITQRPLRLLVHPQASDRPRAQRLLDDLGRPDMLLQSAQTNTPWELLAAIDAVLLGPDPAPLLLPLVRDAGRPILAPDLQDHRELLGSDRDDSQVFWAPDARPRHLAHAITQWLRHEDPTIRPPRATVGQLLAI